MSLEDELFKLINKREYSTARILLANNKNIDINALDEEGSSFFMAAVENDAGLPPERYLFIDDILSHPDFQHANKPIDEFPSSPFQMAISQMNPHLVDLILKFKDTKGIQVVFNKDKLLYELQAHKIQRTKDRRTSPSASSTSSFSDYLDEEQEILTSLLLVTVHHAIKTDDPSLLQQLADTGAKLHYPLKDGTYPRDLVQNQKESKVHLWLSKYIKEQIASSPTYFFAASNLARKHGEQEQALVEQATQATRESVMKMFKFYDFPEDKSADQSEPHVEKKSP